MKGIVTWWLISGTWTWSSHDAPTACYFFLAVFTIAATSCKITWVHKLVGCGAYGSPVNWLIELWRKLLLRCSTRSHLHAIWIGNNLAIMLSIVLAPAYTVIAWRCNQHWLYKILLLMPLWSLGVCFSLLLGLTVSNQSHVALGHASKEAKCARLDFTAWIKQSSCITRYRKVQQVLLLLLLFPLLLPLHTC